MGPKNVRIHNMRTYALLYNITFLIISMNAINVLEQRSVYVRWEASSVQHVIVVMASFQSLVNGESNVLSVG